MRTITIDTTVVDADHTALIEAAKHSGFEVVDVSVTDREQRLYICPSDIRSLMNSQILETLVLGESEIGYAVLGSEEEPDLLEHILKIISNDSFPRPGSRDELLAGPRRQLRDAMILLAHVREHREIFVTDDKKAFVRHGRREKLELLLSTRIMTSKEFLSFLATSF